MTRWRSMSGDGGDGAECRGAERLWKADMTDAAQKPRVGLPHEMRNQNQYNLLRLFELATLGGDLTHHRPERPLRKGLVDQAFRPSDGVQVGFSHPIECYGACARF